MMQRTKPLRGTMSRHIGDRTQQAPHPAAPSVLRHLSAIILGEEGQQLLTVHATVLGRKHDVTEPIDPGRQVESAAMGHHAPLGSASNCFASAASTTPRIRAASAATALFPRSVSA